MPSCNGSPCVYSFPLPLRRATIGTTWNDAIGGALVILLSFPRDTVGEQHGSFESTFDSSARETAARVFPLRAVGSMAGDAVK